MIFLLMEVVKDLKLVFVVQKNVKRKEFDI